MYNVWYGIIFDLFDIKMSTRTGRQIWVVEITVGDFSWYCPHWNLIRPFQAPFLMPNGLFRFWSHKWKYASCDYWCSTKKFSSKMHSCASCPVKVWWLIRIANAAHNKPYSWHFVWILKWKRIGPKCSCCSTLRVFVSHSNPSVASSYTCVSRLLLYVVS